MGPRTRKAKSETPSDEEVEVATDDVKPPVIPKTDETYNRKFVICKDDTISNSKIIKLRHPKLGCALFRYSNKSFDEVVSVDDGHRSWFYGESVIEDGSIKIFAPYNLLFIVIPYLMKTKERFMEIDEILKDEQFVDIKLLANDERVLRLIEKLTDFQDAIDTKVYKLNNEKMLGWIVEKFEVLKEQLKTEVHKSLLEFDDAYDRYVFTFLSDFLSPDVALIVKVHLNIKDAVASENIDMNMKRKIMDEDDEIPKPVVKKARESVVAKKLQAASKGTKSISNFFTKK